jgi:signal transduction histidine kinase
MEDYGGGIDEAELPLLKEKFKRGSNTKDIEGAGLGLYISDYCMKKMQGQLDIENGSAGLKVTVRIALDRRI